MIRQAIVNFSNWVTAHIVALIIFVLLILLVCWLGLRCDVSSGAGDSDVGFGLKLNWKRVHAEGE